MISDDEVFINIMTGLPAHSSYYLDDEDLDYFEDEDDEEDEY